jgi:hypothetical protein
MHGGVHPVEVDTVKVVLNDKVHHVCGKGSSVSGIGSLLDLVVGDGLCRVSLAAKRDDFCLLPMNCQFSICSFRSVRARVAQLLEIVLLLGCVADLDAPAIRDFHIRPGSGHFSSCLLRRTVSVGPHMCVYMPSVLAPSTSRCT